MGNHRCDCVYCKKRILSRERGSHFLKNHKAELFTPENIRYLHHKDYDTSPLRLRVGQEYLFFCLADNSCITKKVMADQHFKGKASGHKTALALLRSEFPPPEGDAPPPPKTPGLSDEDKETLQDFLMSLNHNTDYTLCRNHRLVFEKLGLVADKKSLDDLWNKEYPEEAEETKTPPSEPEKDDEPPIVVEKPLTREDVAKMILTEKVIQDLSTDIVTGEKKPIPSELRSLINPAFRNPIPTPTPPPPPPSYKIIQNSKVKRPIKSVS